MKKTSLKYADFDLETGVSDVVISTEIGDFNGYAFLHEEDKNHASNFIGCEIAELRAYKSYFEEKLKRLNIEIKTAEDINNYLFKKNFTNIDPYIKEKKNYKKYLLSTIQDIKTLEQTKIVEMDKVFRNLDKKHKEDNK